MQSEDTPRTPTRRVRRFRLVLNHENDAVNTLNSIQQESQQEAQQEVESAGNILRQLRLLNRTLHPQTQTQSNLNAGAPAFHPLQPVQPVQRTLEFNLDKQASNQEDDEEDKEFFSNLIQSILKYDGVLYGKFVYKLIEWGLAEAIDTVLKCIDKGENYLLTGTLPSYAITFFRRDFHMSIFNEKPGPINSTIFSINVPSGGCITLLLLHTIQSLTQRLPFCITSLDLIQFSRVGLHINPSMMSRELQHSPAPLFELLKQISIREYIWIDEYITELLSIPNGEKVFYNRWKWLMINKYYNKYRLWVHPTRLELKEHSAKEPHSCQICLDTIETPETQDKDSCTSCTDTKNNGKKTSKSQDTKKYMKLPCSHIMHIMCFVQVEPVDSEVTGMCIRCPMCRASYDILNL